MEIPKVMHNYYGDNAQIIELIDILENLEIKTPINFFRDEKFEINSVFSIIMKIINSTTVKNQFSIFEISYIVNLELSYFKKSIEENNTIYLFLFFIINDAIKINLKKILSFFEITYNDKYKLCEMITSFIDSLEFVKKDLRIGTNTDFYTKFSSINFIENYAFSIINNPLEYTHIKFDLLEAYKYKLIDNLMEMFVNLDIYFFLNFINAEYNPLKIIILLRNLNENTLLILSDKIEPDNKLLIFEIIRTFCLKNEDSGMKIDKIHKLLCILFKTDLKFFIKVKNTCLKNDIFNKGYVKLLSNLNEEEIKNAWAHLEFDKHISNYHTSLFNIIKNNLNPISFKLILEITFEEYEHYLNNKIPNNYFGFVITQYYEFINEYFYKFYSKERITEELYEIINKIKYIEQNWFSSKTELKQTNYIFLTKMLFLSNSYAYNDLNEKNIKNKITTLFDEMYLKRYLNENDLEYIYKIKQNILE